MCGVDTNNKEWENREELMKYIEPDHGYTKKSQ